MELTKKQFDILEQYATAKGELTQRKLAENTGNSLGNTNRIIKGLIEDGYVEDAKITNDGIVALEPYRVKRAVFLASHFNPRLLPVMLNTPTGLIRVKGKRIIDRLLDEQHLFCSSCH